MLVVTELTSVVGGGLHVGYGAVFVVIAVVALLITAVTTLPSEFVSATSLAMLVSFSSGAMIGGAWACGGGGDESCGSACCCASGIEHAITLAW